MAINFIKNGIDTSDANATTTDILNTKTAYVNGEKITGSMPNNGAINITPSTSQQTIPSGYTSGGTVSAVDNNIDSNIQAGNIKKDITILGVTGTLEGRLEINPNNTFADDTAKQYYNIQTAYDNMEPRVLTEDAKEINKDIYCIPVKSDGTPLLDTSKIVYMDMFGSCKNLRSVPLLNMDNAKSMLGTFSGCVNLEFIALLDTSNVIQINNMCVGCTNLKSIPQFNTKNVKIFFYAFQNCTNLVNVPQLDMSNATNLNSVFENCPMLSDESLNNILASLSTATVYTSTKTLAYIGLSQEQATTCTTLSNWAACEAAGWTTGY